MSLSQMISLRSYRTHVQGHKCNGIDADLSGTVESNMLVWENLSIHSMYFDVPFKKVYYNDTG